MGRLDRTRFTELPPGTDWKVVANAIWNEEALDYVLRIDQKTPQSQPLSGQAETKQKLEDVLTER